MLEEWHLYISLRDVRRHQWIPDGTRLTGEYSGHCWWTKTIRTWQIAVIVGHELQALEGMTPPEVTQLDKVTSEVTAPLQITDVNTLLHANRVSLRRKQRAFWRIIFLTVPCALTVLGFLYFPVRSRLCRIISSCYNKSNSPTQN